LHRFFAMAPSIASMLYETKTDAVFAKYRAVVSSTCEPDHIRENFIPAPLRVTAPGWSGWGA